VRGVEASEHAARLEQVERQEQRHVELAAVLMALGLAAILYRAKRRFGMIEPDSALVLLTCLLGLWMLYQHGAAR
jgi:hypothetical protein